MSLIPPTTPGASTRDFKPRLAWATGVVTVAFLVLLGRLYQMQILQGDDYKERADENFVKEIRVPADRGLIFDRNGRVLVDSRPSYDVFLTPYFCGKTCDEVLDRLASLLELTPEEVERARTTLKSARKLERFRPFSVAVDIPRDRLDVVLAHQMDLAGVDVQPTPHRHYRYGSLGSHLIGYMNEIGAEELKRLNEELAKSKSPQGPYYLGDYVGRRGLERRYERELRGIDGKLRVAVDAKGRAKEESDIIPEDQREVKPIPGNNLVLSIDWRLQEAAERAFPGQAGVVLAMEAKTGFLLALVDRPATDPNRMSGRITPAELKAIHSDPLKPELFRAIQAHYQPGSTFKAVTAIAALEEGHYHPGTTVFCPGYFKLGNYRWRCDKDSGHGHVDFDHALGASCNVFFYNVAPLLGADGIARWARALGFGKPTGFDIQGEISGIIPDEAWHNKYIKGGYQKGMAVNVSIGQGDVNVTPMQQLVFYGALASGTLWRPQVVLRIEDPSGNVIRKFEPEARGKLNIKPSTRRTVLSGLLAAVNEKYGTGYWQRVKEFNVAGKTGTAQVVKLGARRLKAEQMAYFHRDHAWFAAFAPAEDPEIVVVVLNEHSGFGSSNAAPTAMAVMKEYMRLKAEDAAGGAPLAEAAARPFEAAPPPRPVAAPPVAPKPVPVKAEVPAAVAAPSSVAAPAKAEAKPADVPPKIAMPPKADVPPAFAAPVKATAPTQAAVPAKDGAPAKVEGAEIVEPAPAEAAVSAESLTPAEQAPVAPLPVPAAPIAPRDVPVPEAAPPSNPGEPAPESAGRTVRGAERGA